MVVKNTTKNVTLVNDLKEAKSLLDQLLGLLRKSNPRSLLFKSHFGIHTFLLKDLIDVMVLDSESRVVKLKTDLKPNRLFFWNIKHYLVIELPKETIKKSNTVVGDKISLD